MLGWCCCDHWEHWKDWTAEDLTIATASLRAQMLRLRQHASLLVWLNGSDNPPPANVEQAYLKVESETHWPNPVLSSATGTPTTVTGESGVKMTGPYDYVAPSYWYVDTHNGGGFGFNTETSPGPAIPSLASRKKFLPDPEAWPPTPTWSLHYGGGEFANLKAFDEAMEAVYAKPQSAADYERMAQTMAYDSERAMFEAYSKNKYFSTGVIQWMLNNAWPSMIWHLYDYYLDAGAGYFATKKACEPLHIQYSYDDRSIVVVNSTYAASRRPAGARAGAWTEVERALQCQATAIDSGPDSAQRVLPIPENLYDRSGTDLLHRPFTFRPKRGHLVSHNFYWVPGTLTDFRLDADRLHAHAGSAPRGSDARSPTLPPAQVEASADVERLRMDAGSACISRTLRARSRFRCAPPRAPASGGLIAPVFWSDNWIELTPGESTELNAQLPEGLRDSCHSD